MEGGRKKKKRKSRSFFFTSPVDSLPGSLAGRTFHASLLTPLLLDVTLFIYLLMYFIRVVRSLLVAESCYRMEERLGKWNLASPQISFRSHGTFWNVLDCSLYLRRRPSSFQSNGTTNSDVVATSSVSSELARGKFVWNRHSLTMYSPPPLLSQCCSSVSTGSIAPHAFLSGHEASPSPLPFRLIYISQMNASPLTA